MGKASKNETVTSAQHEKKSLCNLTCTCLFFKVQVLHEVFQSLIYAYYGVFIHNYRNVNQRNVNQRNINQRNINQRNINQRNVNQRNVNQRNINQINAQTLFEEKQR